MIYVVSRRIYRLIRENQDISFPDLEVNYKKKVIAYAYKIHLAIGIYLRDDKTPHCATLTIVRANYDITSPTHHSI